MILEKYNLEINQIDHIAYYENPNLKLNRIKYAHTLCWPFSFKNFKKDINHWKEKKKNLKYFLRTKLKFKNKLFICKHHLSHAASAFYPSPFSEAALTVDGVGEFETTTFGIGRRDNLELKNA